MSYVKSTLSQNEKIELQAPLHWINYISLALCTLCAFFSLLISAIEIDFIGLAIIFIAYASYKALQLYTLEMTVTNKRVVFRTGIISRKTEELLVQKIESIEIRQTILGRILGYGNIFFSGTGNSVVLFYAVKNPLKLKSQIESNIIK